MQKVLEKRALQEESDNEVMEAYRCSIMERLKICNDVAMWFDSVITEKVWLMYSVPASLSLCL